RHMGRKQARVSQRLCFGRFLNCNHGYNSSSPPDSLTERRFRKAWEKTGKREKETEEERFGRVAQWLTVRGGSAGACRGQTRRAALHATDSTDHRACRRSTRPAG